MTKPIHDEFRFIRGLKVFRNKNDSITIMNFDDRGDEDFVIVDDLQVSWLVKQLTNIKDESNLP